MHLDKKSTNPHALTFYVTLYISRGLTIARIKSEDGALNLKSICQTLSPHACKKTSITYGLIVTTAEPYVEALIAEFSSKLIYRPTTPERNERH